MWTNAAERRILGSMDRVWAVWTDFPARPSWDDHDEWVRIESPLAVGALLKMKTRGAPAATVRVTEIEPGRRIVTEGTVPLGKLRFSFEVTEAGSGYVIARYRQEIIGPMAPLLGRLFGPRIAADAPVTLERLAARVTTDSTS